MYTTRILQAKNKNIISDFDIISKKEKISIENLLCNIIDGSLVIIRNSKKNIQPLAIGSGLRIKINANIGTSSSKSDLKEEIKKMQIAIKYGADAIMDLSTGGNIEEIRKTILEECSVPVGTVPLYEMAVIAKKKKKSILELSADEMFDVIEQHCYQGVDFLTLHCGVTLESVSRFKRSDRIGGAVSRGGTIMMEWIYYNNKENPLYEQYDRLLDICAKYDVCISLGDAFRPGALKDASDRPQIQELVILGELVKRAREKNVGVFVEGPGHVPINQVISNVQMEKTLCNNAPFYVLGPIVTDVSIGYDHISAAIGGALAGMAGADFLCYVTPAEHLRLPSIEDVREGVIASKIAAHAADIARGIKDAIEWDNEITKAKINLDWDKLISLCIDPDKAKKYRSSLLPHEDKSHCSMCDEFCAIKRSKIVKPQ
jgi:phosphomethylpyrimidine synthase